MLDPGQNQERHASESSDHAIKARAEKRAAAVAIGVDSAYISELVETFYASIREDDLLAPIFAERIADWPRHLDRMKQFWRSVLHNSGEFSGNPMLKHMVIPGLEQRHFVRWLELFYATLGELDSSAAASELVGGRARNIADSLLTGIAVRRDGIDRAKEGRNLPHVPTAKS